MFERTVK